MDEPVIADSTPAEVEDVFQGQSVSLSEFSKYRADGELPSRFKPNDTPEETVVPEAEEPEPEPESEPDATQEPPQKVSGAEKRIKQLLAEKKELERKLAGKPDVQPDPSTARYRRHAPSQPQKTRRQTEPPSTVRTRISLKSLPTGRLNSVLNLRGASKYSRKRRKHSRPSWTKRGHVMTTQTM
jgi:hypothetical protein